MRLTVECTHLFPIFLYEMCHLLGGTIVRANDIFIIIGLTNFTRAFERNCASSIYIYEFFFLSLKACIAWADDFPDCFLKSLHQLYGIYFYFDN